MKDFFEPPPPPPELEKPPPIPEWFGPPEQFIAGAVPMEMTLFRSDQIAVLLRNFGAYPNGFEFSLELRRRSDEILEDLFSQINHSMYRRPRQSDQGIPPEVFRFGIQFPDGGKATNLGWPRSHHDDPKALPPGPVLVSHRGGGGGRSYKHEYWVWPLPPDGPVAFVCEWPAADIPLTRKEIEGSGIREAASRAIKLWPE